MDIYAEITARIIAEMKQGFIPWKKPWIGSDAAVSYSTGKPYSLLNQMLLGQPGEYLTYKQCIQAGGYVRKGEKSRMVVFWKWIEEKDPDTDEIQQFPFLRYYNVFHINQCENITAKHIISPCNAVAADETADSIISSYLQKSGVTLRHEANSGAFYRPSDDSVTLPLRSQFLSTSEYYSTAFHELTHSTGHRSRLDRLEKAAFFGTGAYSKEELIAEIGAAALVNAAGLETSDSFRNSTAYIQNWLQVLKNDKRFIVSATGKAEKAVNLILGRV